MYDDWWTPWDHYRDVGLERAVPLGRTLSRTPLILGAGRESCLSWVCLCLCLSGSCVFVVFLSSLRGLAWSPLSQPLLRRLLSCLLTSPVVLGMRFFGLRGYGSDAHDSTVGLEGSALTMVMCSGHFRHGFCQVALPC